MPAKETSSNKQLANNTEARGSPGVQSRVKGYLNRFINRLVIRMYRLSGGAVRGRLQNMPVLRKDRKIDKQGTFQQADDCAQ